MSLLKVNNIESLNGPTGAINMTGNLIVNGQPISGSTGPTGSAGPTGPASVGGIGGTTIVYISADGDPVANGIALQDAYDAAGLLPTTDMVLTSNPLYFDGMSLYMYNSISYNSALGNLLAQTYNVTAGGSPIEITVNGTPAWYSWDGMSIKMSRTIDMMTPVEAGDWDMTFNALLYQKNTLIIGPGYYQTTDTFLINKPYVDVSSVSGNPDVFIYNIGSGTGGTQKSGVHIEADAIEVTGISTDFRMKYASYPGMYSGVNASSPLTLASNLFNLVVKNCVGGDYSFGHRPNTPPIYISGKFIGCKAFNYSFGYDGDTVGGTFENCSSADYSFGYQGTLSGIFTNCIGTYGCFGYSSGSLSGIFIGCRADNLGFFSYSGILSGSFYNCVVTGDQGFGDQNSTNTAAFYNCSSGIYSWRSSSISGACYNCVGGYMSWPSNTGQKLYHCVIKPGPYGSSTFATVTGGGRTFYCIDSYGMTNNQ